MQTYQQVGQKELEPWQTDYQTRPELEHLIRSMWADQLFLHVIYNHDKSYTYIALLVPDMLA